MSRGLVVTATVAWVLANALDILSVLFAVQLGGVFAFARYHPGEYLIIYAGLRALGALVIVLLVLSVSRHWPAISNIVWSALTVCALVTAAAAWWRVYQ
jgi:hypothetical protein